MTVSLIAAVARNGVIGRDGALPWKLSADLKRFRELTTGHHVIMGRKTHESIGKPLPKRTNVVLSRSSEYTSPGCTVSSRLDEALSEAERAGDDEAFVIGGAGVYELALPTANRLYLTRVGADVQGDVHFPDLAETAWREVSREEHGADERNEHPFAFLVLERRS
ncbi:MAG: dihydrofolate reductase [Candidatus Binatia bacterium]|nr:dihydrofolate reductase [Candidatus Binatia bacterium]